MLFNEFMQICPDFQNNAISALKDSFFKKKLRNTAIRPGFCL